MLKKAFAKLGPGDKPILHSDQGWQYRMPVYSRLLKQAKVRPSRSRRGNRLDNATMANLFGTLKPELFYLQKIPQRRRPTGAPEGLHPLLQPRSYQVKIERAQCAILRDRPSKRDNALPCSHSHPD
jgi:transposase InsO family protein